MVHTWLNTVANASKYPITFMSKNNGTVEIPDVSKASSSSRCPTFYPLKNEALANMGADPEDTVRLGVMGHTLELYNDSNWLRVIKRTKEGKTVTLAAFTHPSTKPYDISYIFYINDYANSADGDDFGLYFAVYDAEYMDVPSSEYEVA